MKMAEIKDMTVDQLDDELLKLKKEQLNLRFQQASGQLENTARMREVRRTIARLKTAQSAANQWPERGRKMPKRVLQGTVVSDKGDKTVVVSVERRFTDPVMKKTVRKSKRYHAHDANNDVKIGDKVEIRECRPISKLKSWEVIPGAAE